MDKNGIRSGALPLAHDQALDIVRPFNKVCEFLSLLVMAGLVCIQHRCFSPFVLMRSNRFNGSYFRRWADSFRSHLSGSACLHLNCLRQLEQIDKHYEKFFTRTSVRSSFPLLMRITFKRKRRTPIPIDEMSFSMLCP